MCGIGGVLGGDGLDSAIRAMTATLEHRGPDDEGLWVDAGAGVALGQRRLAILDLSPLGRQPMFSASGRYAVVFNGEIYNFRELRAELEPLGHAFKGGSDTEVLLGAVEEWGLRAALDRFVGMFAIGLWDARERLLHLVRDRMGIKPLYWGMAGRALVFGSELKCLRAHPAFDPELDRSALCSYFRFNHVPAPYSVHRHARKLLPGHMLTVDPARLGGVDELRPEPWWSLEEVWSEGARDPFPGDAAEAADELERILSDAVRLRMIADVPLGALLSGGIDSSTVAALMRQNATGLVRTFSIGFHEKHFDEAAHARKVAEHLGCEHTELYLRPEEMLETIPLIPRFWDEPFADSSQIPTYHVFKLARPHVTVALSGDGGDELFAGYRRYYWASRWAAFSRLPAWLRKGAARTLSAIPEQAWRMLGPVGPKLGRRAGLLGEEDFKSLFLKLVSHYDDPAEIMPGRSERPIPLTGRHPSEIGSEVYRLMQYLDLISYLPDDILTKVDRASMAVSLEARVPILDHRVVAFAARLTPRHNVASGHGKQPLRRILHKYVPRELTERPKQGFAVPISRWLRGELRDWAESLLERGRIEEQGIVDAGLVRAMWRDYLKGNERWTQRLWGVLMLQAWLDFQD